MKVKTQLCSFDCERDKQKFTIKTKVSWTGDVTATEEKIHEMCNNAVCWNLNKILENHENDGSPTIIGFGCFEGECKVEGKEKSSKTKKK